MQDQETEGSTPFSETSVYNEAPQATNTENIPLIIDFDSIEDILDFSLHSPTEASKSKSDKKCPPRLRKMIAQEPVKLLELKPIIDNFVDDEVQNVEDDDDYVTETKSRRFQCIVCGSKFIRSTHLHRHMRLHTGAKPYACYVCRKRFSRSDYMSAHALSHRTDKVHCCCVCGEIYFDLTRFADHCHSHDDSEYIAMSNTLKESKTSFRKQVLVVEDEIPVTTAAKEMELESCIKFEKVDNSTDEECIVCIKNPIYVSDDQTISINNNDVTSVTGNDTSTTDGLIISIAIKNLTNFTT